MPVCIYPPPGTTALPAGERGRQASWAGRLAHPSPRCLATLGSGMIRGGQASAAVAGGLRSQRRCLTVWEPRKSGWREKVQKRLTEDISKGVHERQRSGALPAGQWPWSDEHTASYTRCIIKKEAPPLKDKQRAKEFLQDLLGELQGLREQGCEVGSATFTALFDLASTQGLTCMGLVWEAAVRDKIRLRTRNWQQILAFHGRQRDPAAVRWTLQTYLNTGAAAESIHASYIRALVVAGEKAEAMAHFRAIRSPTQGAYSAAVTACDSYEAGAALVQEMQRRGFVVDIDVYTGLLLMLARLPDPRATERVFAQVAEVVPPTPWCWESLMEVYRNTSDLQGGLSVLARMRKAEVVTPRALICLVELCSTLQTASSPIPSVKKVVDLCEDLGRAQRAATVGALDHRYYFLDRVVAKYRAQCPPAGPSKGVCGPQAKPG